MRKNATKLLVAGTTPKSARQKKSIPQKALVFILQPANVSLVPVSDLFD